MFASLEGVDFIVDPGNVVLAKLQESALRLDFKREV